MTIKDKKFLTSDKDGFALYVGDVVYSEFHKEIVILEGIFIDGDGEVFLTCREGTLRVKNARRLEVKDLQALIDSFKFNIIDELPITLNNHKKFDNLILLKDY